MVQKNTSTEIYNWIRHEKYTPKEAVQIIKLLTERDKRIKKALEKIKKKKEELEKKEREKVRKNREEYFWEKLK